MPRKTDSIAIDDPFLDRRIKLIPCQRERCISLHKSGMSIRALGRMFHVDKTTITFILYPDRLVENKHKRLLRGGWKQYYDKDKNRDTIKEHRDYKKIILK